MQHIKALDGVRGVAILLVILFHYGYLGCGWIGVQLFFVLSGFLITSILVKDKGKSLKDYLKRFYWRRSLRIFPLYYLYLFVMLAAFLLFRIPPAFGDQWPYLFTYTYNVRHILPNYDGSELLIHLWSLSVEEQFYLVWPLLVFLLATRRFKSLLLAIVIGIPIVRLLTSLLLANAGHDPLFYGTVLYTITPFQIDAFAVGAIVATFKFPHIKNGKVVFAVAVVVAVALGLLAQFTSPVMASDRVNSFGFPIHLLHHYEYVWGYSVLNIVAGLLILLVVQGSSPLPFLKNGPLTFLGRISYGVYVYHYGVLAIFQKVFPSGERSLRSLLLFFPYLAVTLVISYLSFRLFENQFLKLKDRKSVQKPPTIELVSETAQT
ncbi:MAG TPA: acyltransferase [Pyrinomonadaceae bacterium]